MLAAFGSSMHILQLSKTSNEVGHHIVDDQWGHFMINGIHNQYMLGLGDFKMDGFEHHNEVYVVWIFFLLATFITQIVFLNMLIAIMGNTFDYVVERKVMYALQTKLNILSDYYYVIKKRNPPQDTNIYLFVVRPKTDAGNDGEDAWEGGFSFLKNILSRET